MPVARQRKIKSRVKTVRAKRKKILAKLAKLAELTDVGGNEDASIAKLLLGIKRKRG